MRFERLSRGVGGSDIALCLSILNNDSSSQPSEEMQTGLIPKDVDVRGLSKKLLSNAFGKTPLRLVKVKDLIRTKYGDIKFSRHHWTKNDNYYVKLAELLSCGKHGVVETDVNGATRYRPWFCNMRRYCIECFNRYRKGLRWINEDRLLAVARANRVPGLVFATYTLHPEIRQAIPPGIGTERVNFLNEINRLAVDSLKQGVGVWIKRGSDITGIVSVMHPFGSDNPFKPGLHFHMVWIPLKITKSGRVERITDWIDLERARAIWQSAQVRFAKKHGINLAGSETNFFFEFVPLHEDRKLKQRIRYIFRSLLDDLFISLRYLTDDLKGFLWFEDVGSDWLPHLDKWDVLKRALDSYMSYPVKMIRSYGFLRNLKKHSKVLNLKQVKAGPDFVPVATVRCDFRRIYRRIYIRSTNKHVFRLSIQARYKERPWHNVPLEAVIGENSTGGTNFKWIRGP